MAGERVGFIGTGIMGGPMALNLLKAGYAVTVHNRTKSKAKAVLAAGASWAETPADAAGESDIVITCVPDTPDVKKVLLGENGVIEGARSGLICVDMSTISPAATREMGKILQGKGVTLLDAPISGGEIGAIEGKLSIMMGGPKEAFEKVRPVMEVMGKAVIHCGPLGAGQMTKLVNQVMVIHTIMSIAEGLAFAEKAGLDLETTWQVTSAGAAGSHSLKVLGRKIIDGDLKPAFMVDLQQKDLRLVMELADELKQPLPGVALAKQLLGVLQAQGRGRDGTQAMIDVIRQLAKKLA
ncbi:MAG TPA: NAD(P)-dependent oxidoreductase [Sedimentisphaerales bacterium]|nr:NAD(P)-dependent oxidoreductase [Sedimentisphaerales bacterium]